MAEPRLTAREEAVLLAMADNLPVEHGAPFKAINRYVRGRCGERDGCEPWNIRRTVRALARKKMAYLERLFSDDGMVMGSGYMLSDDGRAYADRVFAAPAPADAR